MTEPKDFGTPQIARKFTVVPKMHGPYTQSMKVMDETEIDKCLLRGDISPSQHSSLEGLLRRLHKLGFVGVKSPSYESSVQVDPSIIGDKRANLLRGIIKIFGRMDNIMGEGKRKALVNLVLLDAPWPSEMGALSEAVGLMDDAIAGR